MSWNIKKGLQGLLNAETGTVVKDFGGKTSVALVYPNTYFVGMSNLGVHNVYRLLNGRDDFVCERAFLPERKELAEHERTKTPVMTVESQRPIGEFDIIAFSVAFENDISNIERILAISKIEPLDPRLVVGGAAATLNPGLFNGFFANVMRGDFEMIRHCEPANSGQSDLLFKISIGGSLANARDDIVLAHNVIWTRNTEFGNMHLVEMQRGCPHHCKFCAAPVIYSPFTQFDKEAIIDAIAKGLPHRNKIGLIGGDILAHPSFKEIAEYIHSKGATFSPSSVRADRIDEDIAKLLKISGHKTITLAPEAGSEKLRRSIGKSIPDEKFFAAAKLLSKNGINRFKLYFMIGLPGETEKDIEAITLFTKRFILEGGSKVTVAVNPFVPKSGTPFNGEPFAGIGPIKRKITLLKSNLGRLKGVSFKAESPITAHREYELQV